MQHFSLADALVWESDSRTAGATRSFTSVPEIRLLHSALLDSHVRPCPVVSGFLLLFVVRPDYVKELQKPLKPPPRGLEWRRYDDGSWELRTIKVADAAEGGCQADDVNGTVKLSGCLFNGKKKYCVAFHDAEISACCWTTVNCYFVKG